MKPRFATKFTFVATLLLSHAAFAAPRMESNADARLATAPHTAMEAEAITANLQAKLNNDVQAETIERITSDSRDELGRQLRNMRLFLQDVPAITSEFQITVSNPDRKMRLASQ